MSAYPQTDRQSVHLYMLPSAILRSGHGITWLSYVGIAEQTKAAQYRNPEDALNYAAQQTLMRCIAACALGIRPTHASQITVDRTCQLCDQKATHGKPRISGINFNMSRSHGMVVGAYFAEDSQDPQAQLLGVDIERMRGNLLDGYDKVTLTEEEKTVISECPEENKALLRLLLWTAKEAVLKATGHGLVAGPQKVHMQLLNPPQNLVEISGYRASGTLNIEGYQQQFYVQWFVQGEFVIAVATNQNRTIKAHPVTKPYDIKQSIPLSTQRLKTV
ncbi:4'-phosphopantetheinyl transferase family protein [Rothia sp. P6271]|uniref:4'-phosphopantetheinyl transferase family protein n=1 Tax=Rothia sp. P6271 TaxID=3402659 RepID=UPI003AD05013